MSRVKKLKKIRVPASGGRAKPNAEASSGVKPAASAPLSTVPAVKLSVRAEVSKAKASVPLEMALSDETLWVENKNGETLAHLLIGAIESGALAKVLTEGGTIAARTLQAALFRPWASAEARAPWAKGYATLLAQETDALDMANSLAVGQELSELLPLPTSDKKATRF